MYPAKTRQDNNKIDLAAVNSSCYFLNISSVLDILPFPDMTITPLRFYQKMLRANKTLLAYYRNSTHNNESEVQPSLTNHKKQGIMGRCQNKYSKLHQQFHSQLDNLPKNIKSNNNNADPSKRFSLQQVRDAMSSNRSVSYNRLPTLSDAVQKPRNILRYEKKPQLSPDSLQHYRRFATDSTCIDDNKAQSKMLYPRIRPDNNHNKQKIEAIQTQIVNTRRGDGEGLREKHPKSPSPEKRQMVKLKKLLLDKPVLYDSILYNDTSTLMLQGPFASLILRTRQKQSSSIHAKSNLQRKYWNLQILKVVKASRQQHDNLRRGLKSPSVHKQQGQNQPEFSICKSESKNSPKCINHNESFERNTKSKDMGNLKRVQTLPLIKSNKKKTKDEEPALDKSQDNNQEDAVAEEPLQKSGIRSLHISDKILAECKGIKKLMRLGVYR